MADIAELPLAEHTMDLDEDLSIEDLDGMSGGLAPVGLCHCMGCLACPTSSISSVSRG